MTYLIKSTITLLVLVVFISCKGKTDSDYYRDMYQKYYDSAMVIRYEVTGAYAATLISRGSCAATHVYDSMYDKIHQLDRISDTYWEVYKREKNIEQ